MDTAVAIGLLTVWLTQAADHGYGPLPPKPLPAVMVMNQDGTAVPLPDLVRGKAVAVHFIFTSCSTACPLLGSLFRSTARRLPAANRDRMLLSISVDPERDTPARLKGWLTQHGGSPRWQAVTLAPKDLELVLEAFGQKSGTLAAHSTQVFYVSTKGEIVGRTTALPDSAGVASELIRLP